MNCSISGPKFRLISLCTFHWCAKITHVESATKESKKMVSRKLAPIKWFSWTPESFRVIAETKKIINSIFASRWRTMWYLGLTTERQVAKFWVVGDLYSFLPFNLKIVRPSHRSYINVTRSKLPPCSIHGMRGSRKTSCDGLANKNNSCGSINDLLRKGSFTVWLTSCLICLDSAKWVFTDMCALQ